VDNCKICNKQGSLKIDIPYNSEKCKSFINNYYNEYSDEITSILKNKNYSILICLDCEFMWQKYIPDENFLFELYEKYIDPKKSFKKFISNRDKLSNSFHQEAFNILALFKYKDPKEIKILDYGSGWGGWILETRKILPGVDGLEFSPSRSKYLLENNINLIKLDDIKIKKDYYNFVRCEQVLEHLSDLTLFFKLMSTIIKKNCYLHVSVPNAKKIIKNNKIELYLNKGPSQPLEHLNAFTPKSLIKVANKYGFKELSIIKLLLIYKYKGIFSIKNFKNFIKSLYNFFFNTSKYFQKID